MTWFSWITPILSACSTHLSLLAAFVAPLVVILGIRAFQRLIGDFRRV